MVFLFSFKVFIKVFKAFQQRIGHIWCSSLEFNFYELAVNVSIEVCSISVKSKHKADLISSTF